MEPKDTSLGYEIREIGGIIKGESNSSLNRAIRTMLWFSFSILLSTNASAICGPSTNPCTDDPGPGGGGGGSGDYYERIEPSQPIYCWSSYADKVQIAIDAAIANSQRYNLIVGGTLYYIYNYSDDYSFVQLDLKYLGPSQSQISVIKFVSPGCT